ncbi:MAG: hypothetical protein ACRDPC_01605 [Solirubrobacteraceae bacterium]
MDAVLSHAFLHEVLEDVGEAIRMLVREDCGADHHGIGSSLEAERAALWVNSLSGARTKLVPWISRAASGLAVDVK